MQQYYIGMFIAGFITAIIFGPLLLFLMTIIFSIFIGSVVISYINKEYDKYLINKGNKFIKQIQEKDNSKE